MRYRRTFLHPSERRVAGAMPPSITDASSSCARPRVLVVFDFDFSLVDDDSDVRVLRELCPELLAAVAASLHTPPPSWPALLDATLGDLAHRMPHVKRDDVVRTVGAIAVAPRMVAAVRLAAHEHGASVAIVSDANSVSIESMLQHNSLRECIEEVHTNPAHWDAQNPNRLRVRPYHDHEKQAPHGCGLCPVNMCKGRVLDALRAKTRYDVVLYVGDGIGDYCPTTRLTSKDTVFARVSEPSGKACALLQKIQAEPERVVATVVPWQSADDIYTHFEHVFSGIAASSSTA